MDVATAEVSMGSYESCAESMRVRIPVVKRNSFYCVSVLYESVIASLLYILYNYNYPMS